VGSVNLGWLYICYGLSVAVCVTLLRVMQKLVRNALQALREAERTVELGERYGCSSIECLCHLQEMVQDADGYT
jgi:hypothetical protein